MCRTLLGFYQINRWRSPLSLKPNQKVRLCWSNIEPSCRLLLWYLAFAACLAQINSPMNQWEIVINIVSIRQSSVLSSRAKIGSYWSRSWNLVLDPLFRFYFYDLNVFILQKKWLKSKTSHVPGKHSFISVGRNRRLLIGIREKPLRKMWFPRFWNNKKAFLQLFG